MNLFRTMKIAQLDPKLNFDSFSFDSCRLTFIDSWTKKEKNAKTSLVGTFDITEKSTTVATKKSLQSQKVEKQKLENVLQWNKIERCSQMNTLWLVTDHSDYYFHYFGQHWNNHNSSFVTSPVTSLMVTSDTCYTSIGAYQRQHTNNKNFLVSLIF